MPRTRGVGRAGSSAVCAPEQGIATGGQRTASALSRPSFTAKGQREIAQGHMQPRRALCGRGDASGKAFAEGAGRADRMEAAQAPDVQQEANGHATHRQIARLARGGAMDARLWKHQLCRQRTVSRLSAHVPPWFPPHGWRSAYPSNRPNGHVGMKRPRKGPALQVEVEARPGEDCAPLMLDAVSRRCRRFGLPLIGASCPGDRAWPVRG